MIIALIVFGLSTAGWLVSFAFKNSAVRRHLVLTATLASCWLALVSYSMRERTNWTILALPDMETAAQPTVFPTEAEHAPVASQERHESAADAPSPVHTDDVARAVAIEKQTSPLVETFCCPTPDDRQAVGESTSPHGAGAADQSLVVANVALWIVWFKRMAPWLYFTVAALLLIRLAIRYFKLFLLKHGGRRVEQVVASVPVLECVVHVPVALGFGRGAIGVPRGFCASVTPVVLRDVLRHEEAHLQRGDHWVLLFQQLSAILFWPLPTIYLVNRALNLAREELCDNVVIQERCADEYGQSLLHVAAQCGVPKGVMAAPTIVSRGDFERRIAGILDARRDRSVSASGTVRYAVAGLLLVSAVLAGTTRLEADSETRVTEETVATEASRPEVEPAALPEPNRHITWTDIPLVDENDCTLHRGVVLGPDDKPVAGAAIRAASTVELFEMDRDVDSLTPEDLGAVRAVTDDLGRFEFHAPDLVGKDRSGKEIRWEALLVATKEGLAAGFHKTWGEDRGLRSHWHPHVSTPVVIPMRPPTTIEGRLTLANGVPLADANVRLTAIQVPVDRDLEKHIEQEEVRPAPFLGTKDFDEYVGATVLPGVTLTTRTDAEGHFALHGLPEGFIAVTEVTHPKAMTTTIRAALREIDTVYMKYNNFGEPLSEQATSEQEREPVLYGSAFTAALQTGVTLKGTVISREWGNRKPIPGIRVALANHNTSKGFYGQEFVTDEQGRFEVSGLYPNPAGHSLAFVGSFDAPFESTREIVSEGQDARIELRPAFPYRLKLTDSQGQPVDRKVRSIEVQSAARQWKQGIRYDFDTAERVAPGVYEGIIPLGNGAVIVERARKSDRPIALDPKAFFEPGRTDWTAEELRHAYGTQRQIAKVAIKETEKLAIDMNPVVSQLDLAAALFTSPRQNAPSEMLELSATIHTDPPATLEIVDASGNPVSGASISREMDRYDISNAVASIDLYGLHPEVPERFIVSHREKGLYGAIESTWSDKPIRVVLEEPVFLTGKIVDASGRPAKTFGIRLIGKGVLPDKLITKGVGLDPQVAKQRPGEFEFQFAAGNEIRGELVRITSDWKSRPPVRTVFGPVTPEPGERIELGDVVVP